MAENGAENGVARAGLLHCGDFLYCSVRFPGRLAELLNLMEEGVEGKGMLKPVLAAGMADAVLMGAAKDVSGAGLQPRHARPPQS